MSRTMLAAVVVAVMLCPAVSRLRAAVEVVVDPYPADPNVETFPDADPPDDLKAGEDGDASTSVGVDGQDGDNGFSAQNTADGVVIGPVKVTVSADPTRIRIPESHDNDDSDLKKHEIGHHDLYAWEYGQRAERKAEDALRGFSGKEFVGEGDTAQERQDSAYAKAQEEFNRILDRIKDAIEKQGEELGKKYDKLTDHGESTTVDTAKGVAETKKERNKATGAGDEKKEKDDTKTSSWIGDPPWVQYDSSLDRLVFGGDMIIDGAADPTDALIGLGRVEIDPIIIIGLQENGTIHLSDTHLRIFDDVTDDLLMDAFLFELAYMDSNLDGFAGMIQCFLDVPPAFAEGTDNTIGSTFLTDIQAAADAGDDTTFWFYTTTALLDSLGDPVPAGGTGAPPGVSAVVYSPITGSMKLAVAVPTPTAIMAGLILLPITLVARIYRTRFRPAKSSS